MKIEGIPPYASLGIKEWKGKAKPMRGGNCQLPSGSSAQGYSSFLFSSGFTGEGGCQQQPAEWRMLCEHQGDKKNLPPVLICQDKSADCSPFMQKFPENFTASRHRETLPAPNRIKLPTLQVSQNPLKTDSEIPRDRKWEVFSSPSTE